MPYSVADAFASLHYIAEFRLFEAHQSAQEHRAAVIVGDPMTTILAKKADIVWRERTRMIRDLEDIRRCQTMHATANVSTIVNGLTDRIWLMIELERISVTERVELAKQHEDVLARERKQHDDALAKLHEEFAKVLDMEHEQHDDALAKKHEEFAKVLDRERRQHDDALANQHDRERNEREEIAKENDELAKEREEHTRLRAELAELRAQQAGPPLVAPFVQVKLELFETKKMIADNAMAKFQQDKTFHEIITSLPFPDLAGQKMQTYEPQADALFDMVTEARRPPAPCYCTSCDNCTLRILLEHQANGNSVNDKLFADTEIFTFTAEDNDPRGMVGQHGIRARRDIPAGMSLAPTTLLS